MSTAISSGALAVGTTTVVTGKSYLNSVTVLTDGTNAATVTIHDNTSAAGTKLFQYSVAGAGLAAHCPFSFAVRADVGLTVVVAGTGAQAIVHYGAASS